MSEVTRNRTIRPSSRKESSKSYKVNTKTVVSGDLLVVNIDHETKSFRKRYTFNGKDVANKDSISFRVNETDRHIDIAWSGATPLEESSGKVLGYKIPTPNPKPIKPVKIKDGEIQSFPPIEDPNSKVLILGTMPGVESLKRQAYYAHPRNLLWKLLAQIIDQELPASYEEKIAMAKALGVALWDICHACIRDGSLDADISSESPNDIQGFVVEHPKLQAIAFNGKKAAQLYAKHIGIIPGIRLLSLPSTSPANAGVSWVEKLEEWGKIKEYL